MLLIAILHYIEAKFDYSYFIIFLCCGSKILHKKFQVILTKNQGVTVIFWNFDLVLNRKNKRHAFIFARNDLKFLGKILEPQFKQNYKIAIVKFCL